MKKILLAAIMGIVLSSSLYSQDLKVVSSNNDGVAYTLPATAFVVDITVERTDVFQGPLMNYARPLMGIENPVRKDGTKYRILSVGINEMAVSDNGTITTLSYSGERNSRESVSSTVSSYGNGTLAGVNLVEIPFTSRSSYAFSVPSWEIEKPDFEFFLAGPNQVTETDTIVKLITLDTATVRDVSYKHRLVERSEEDKAQEIVEKILKLRRDRMSLLTGYQEVAYSEGTMRYMDEQFQTLESKYLSLFRGCSATDVKTYSIVVVPSADDRNGEVTVCGFTESGGVNLTSANGGAVELAFTTVEITEATGTGNGVKYRIPATSQITVKNGSNVLGGGIFVVPQFGVVKTAPATANPKVQIDPATGVAIIMDID